MLLASLFVVMLLGFQSGPFAAQAPSTNLTYGVTNSIGQVDVSNVPDASGNAQNQHEQQSVHEVDPQQFAQEKGRAESPGFVPPGEATKDIVSPSGAAPLTVSSSLTLEGAPGGLPNPCSCSPPDPNLGVGPNHVFEMVNLAGIIYDKSGTLVKGTFPLWSFFLLSSTSTMSDPEILFDALSGRWFASIIDIDNGKVQFAVSTSNDPTGTWKVYSVTASQSSMPDQPFIGTSDDKFVISANDFADLGQGGFIGVQYWILNKAQLVSGAASVSFATNSPDPTMFSLHPARHLTSTAVFYMITNCLSACVIDPASTTSTARLVAVSGTPPGAVTVTGNTFSIATSTSPPNAQQPGTSALLATNDNRVLSASWESNTLWFSWIDACVPAGDTVTRSCARLIQVTTAGTAPPTKVQDFDYASSGQYFFYPAVSLHQGQLVVVYGQSSSTVYPSLLVTGRAPGDLLNTLQTPFIVRSGTAANPCCPYNRYGDYFGAATDPTPSPSGLVGYWPLDENTGTLAHDLSGNGYVGTLINSPTWQSGGNCKFGNCLSFTGTDYVTSNSLATNVFSGATVLSVSFWMYYKGLDGSYQIPLSIHTGGNSGWSFESSGDSTTFIFYTNDGPNTVNAPLVTNAWSFITEVIDGTTKYLYVNGALRSSALFSSALTSFTHFDIGSRMGTLGLKGQMDDIRVYNRAISASEISGLYLNGPSAGFWVAGEYRVSSGFQSWNTAIARVAVVDPLSVGLVGYWPLDEGTGTLAYDPSGNGNSGTLINSPTWQTGANCKFGNCLLFSGATDDVSGSGAASLFKGKTVLSVSFWFKPTGLTGTTKEVFNYGTSSEFGFESNGNSQQYLFYTNNGYGTVIRVDLSPNVWTHIVLVMDGTNKFIYTNGLLVSTTAFSAAINIASNDKVWWGGRAETYGFKGYIDDIRVYNRALSASEIAGLYAIVPS